MQIGQMSEATIRIVFFVGVLGLISSWELLSPRRKLSQKKISRWLSNLGLVSLNTVLVRIVLPMSAVGFAHSAQENSWGLFNNIQIPLPWAVVASLLLLDLAIYLQHVSFHVIPLFWRFHKMHHADMDIDVTTGVRFHPMEILLSMGIKLAVIALLGIPVLAVLIFEVVLNAMSMFTHGNVYILEKCDRYLRWIFVTPDMHRIHHSIYVEETNSNFGFHVSLWDRLFRTYKEQPKDGQINMVIGCKDSI
jgi:sterol desaturase/sphingolipid hydroxylase (fatty acid hydroxylase superfamily)